jgi:hypothetical protein
MPEREVEMAENNIEDFIKNKDNSARIVAGTRWLYWDEINNQWIVQSRTHGQKRNRCQYSGEDISEALFELRKGQWGV